MPTLGGSAPTLDGLRTTYRTHVVRARLLMITPGWRGSGQTLPCAEQNCEAGGRAGRLSAAGRRCRLNARRGAATSAPADNIRLADTRLRPVGQPAQCSIGPVLTGPMFHRAGQEERKPAQESRANATGRGTRSGFFIGQDGIRQGGLHAPAGAVIYVVTGPCRLALGCEFCSSYARH